MSAPNKKGLDYFPHDVDLSNDQKIEYIEAELGIIGYAIYLKLLEKIYHVGYYLKWNDRDSKLFAKHNNIEVNACINSINVIINEGLFCKNMYNKYAILTSKSIQERYFEASNRRKELKIYKGFLLLDNDIMKNKYKNIVIVDINPINVNINEVNDNINSVIVEQSKVKGKVNKKEYMCKFDEFYSLYPKKRAKKKAIDAWMKLKFNDGLFENIISSLKLDIDSKEWNEENGKFIPLPATWLNGKRWEDSHEAMKIKKEKDDGWY